MECGRQKGKKGEDEAALPAVHYQFPFPPQLSSLVVHFLPTGISMGMCFHQYCHSDSPLTMALFPLHFLHPQPLCPPPPLHPLTPQTRQASSVLPRLFNISSPAVGCFIYRVRETCSDPRTTESHQTIQQLGNRGQGVTAQRSKARGRRPLRCQRRVCTVRVCLCMSHVGHAARSRPNNIAIS